MVNFNLRESKRIWSVNEVIEMLEEEEFLQADVFLSLPNNGLLSDEDSDDEEGVSADHFSGPQLSAPAKFCINFGNSVESTLKWDLSAVEANFDVSDNALSSSVCKSEENSLLLLKPATSCISWKRNELTLKAFL